MAKKRKVKKVYAITPSEMMEKKVLEKKNIKKLARKTGQSVKSVKRQRTKEQEDKENRFMQALRNVDSSEFTLVSKRGTRVAKETTCDECLTIHGTVWYYAQSSIGPVNLCARCKEIVRARSFMRGSIDALDLAHTGGRFEGNRRKH